MFGLPKPGTKSPPPVVHLPWHRRKNPSQEIILCLKKTKQNKGDLTKADAFLETITSFSNLKGISQPEFQLRFECRGFVHLQSSSARQELLCFEYSPVFPIFSIFPRGIPCVSPVDGPCGMQVNSSTGGRIQVLVLPPGKVVPAPPSRYLEACPWTPKTINQQQQLKGLLFHTQLFQFLLPPLNQPLLQRKLQPKLTFPNHSQGIIAMQTKRFLCSSESLQQNFHP